MDEAVIRLHIERLEEGGYVATSPDVPGLVAEGRSIVETVEIAKVLREGSPNRAWNTATRCRRRSWVLPAAARWTWWFP